MHRGIVNVCTANTWPVFIALGRPWINTALTALGIVVLIPLLLWSVPQAGTVGAAWALVAAAAWCSPRISWRPFGC